MLYCIPEFEVPGKIVKKISMIIILFLTLFSAATAAAEGLQEADSAMRPMWSPERPINLIIPRQPSSAAAAAAEALAVIIEKRLKQKIIPVYHPEMAGLPVHDIPRDGYTWVAASTADPGMKGWTGFYAFSIPLILVGPADTTAAPEKQSLAVPETEDASLFQYPIILPVRSAPEALAAVIRGECGIAAVRSGDAAPFLRSRRVTALGTFSQHSFKIAGYGSIDPLPQSLLSYTRAQALDGPGIGIFLPPGSPEMVLNTLNSIWDHEVKKSPDLSSWAADRGFAFYPETGTTLP